MSRRLFLGRITAAVAGVGALGTVGYGDQRPRWVIR